jgi:hypothetical protein
MIKKDTSTQHWSYQRPIGFSIIQQRRLACQREEWNRHSVKSSAATSLGVKEETSTKDGGIPVK